MMKNVTRFSLVIFILLPLLTFAQVWVNSDSIGVKMKGYGELEIYGPVTAGDTTKQIDRITLLVAAADTTVFDYNEDADEDIPAMLVADPTLSDMEGFASINNFYSFAPPDIHAEISPYAWNGTEYLIVHMLVTNTADAAIIARLGFDIIPQIDGDYDGVNNWNSDGEFLEITRAGSDHFGLKFLSHSMVSLRQFVWYSGYNGSDADLFAWMNYGLFDSSIVETDPDGGIVSIPSTAPMTMEPDVGIDFYYGIAHGVTLENLQTNMVAAETAYNSIFTVGVDEPDLQPSIYSLAQNYPNPFNPSTQISFTLPEAGFTSLEVFNIRGELVKTIRNEWMAAGSYTHLVVGSELSSGVYVYSLRSGSTQINKKMTLLK